MSSSSGPSADGQTPRLFHIKNGVSHYLVQLNGGGHEEERACQGIGVTLKNRGMQPVAVRFTVTGPPQEEIQVPREEKLQSASTQVKLKVHEDNLSAVQSILLKNWGSHGFEINYEYRYPQTHRLLTLKMKGKIHLDTILAGGVKAMVKVLEYRYKINDNTGASSSSGPRLDRSASASQAEYYHGHGYYQPQNAPQNPPWSQYPNYGGQYAPYPQYGYYPPY